MCQLTFLKSPIPELLGIVEEFNDFVISYNFIKTFHKNIKWTKVTQLCIFIWEGRVYSTVL